MLISESYREQNAALHTVNPYYGRRGRDWIPIVEEIVAKYGYRTVLDYGCGKGTFAASAPEWLEVRQYDPAIAGKDSPPEPADLVICTDVLEHIEPDCIKAVIEHIHSLVQGMALLSIALGPSLKKLPDGRSTHQIIQSKQWWRDQLSPLFVLDDIAPAHGTNFIVQAKPIREVSEIQSISAMADDVRNEHVRRNIKAVPHRLKDSWAPHNRLASLACFGPSLKATYRFLKGDVFCVGAAHSFLIDHGIIPEASIDCDPRSRVADQLGKPHREVSYWLASCINPAYVQKLDGFDISLFHLHNGESSANFIWEHEPDAWLLNGGGSVGLRAISLLYAQGYRKIEIHGMDSSYAEDQEYAGTHTGPEKKKILRVRCHDRWFQTNPQLIDYARQFISDRPLLWPDAEIRLHGDGLLQEMCKC